MLVLAAALGGCAGAPGSISFHPLVPPSVAGAPQSSDPAVASLPDSRGVILAWFAGGEAGWRLYTAHTDDGGDRWSAPVAVTPPGEAIHPHGESSPKVIAAGGGRVAVVWATSWNAPGREWPASAIRFARSMDGGRTWSAPITLNDDSTAAPGSHSFQGVTLDGDSSIVVAWLDERKFPGEKSADSEAAEDASLYSVRSGDFGATWGFNKPLTGRVCPCCRVQLCAASGVVTAAWRRHFTGQIRDIVVADLGSAPVRVQEDNWVFAGCPHTGPALVAGLGGVRHIAWYTGAQGKQGVYYSRLETGSTDRERVAVPVEVSSRLSTSRVGLAWAKSVGPVLAFDVDSTGAQTVTIAQIDPDRGSVRARAQVPGSDGGRYPQLAVVHGSRDVLLAWTFGEASASQIRMARVSLGG
jgi:hypothetical protein